MALVECRECKAAISDLAAACPQCGAPRGRPVAASQNVGCGAALVLIVAMGFAVSAYVKYRESKAPPPAPPTEAELRAQAQAAADRAQDERIAGIVGACRGWIHRSLRDPDSADFLEPLTADVPMREVSPGNFQATLTVRAANGFGGKTVSRFVCDVAEQGSTLRLVKLRELR